jgi:hypothetical protein
MGADNIEGEKRGATDGGNPADLEYKWDASGALKSRIRGGRRRTCNLAVMSAVNRTGSLKLLLLFGFDRVVVRLSLARNRCGASIGELRTHWLWNRRSVVRAHPTVPPQQKPLWLQHRVDRPDLFARSKYKERYKWQS